MVSSDLILLAIATVGLGLLAYAFMWFIDKQAGVTKNLAPPNTDAVEALNEEINELMQQHEDGGGNKDAKKALAKVIKKKEKAEKKAQDDYQRDVRKAREEQRIEDDRKKDEERLKKREEEEQHLLELEEERLRQEEEEYKKWEQYIVVEGEGTDLKEDILLNENRIHAFIDYLSKRKVCILDEVAAEFNMTNEEVLETITKLEEKGEITVIVDDRGKLIVVTEEEMKYVVEVIKKQGRISLSTLTKKCGGIVQMNT